MGAKHVLNDVDEFNKLKLNIIDAGEFKYSHGSNDSLKIHMEELKKEFHGKSELEFYHAQLNVLLRRKYRLKETYKKFKKLWDNEHTYLVKKLNTRWLISAADSFLDNDKDDHVKHTLFIHMFSKHLQTI